MLEIFKKHYPQNKNEILDVLDYNYSTIKERKLFKEKQ